MDCLQHRKRYLLAQAVGGSCGLLFLITAGATNSFLTEASTSTVQCTDLKRITEKSNKQIPLCNQHLNQDMDHITSESFLVYTPLSPHSLSQPLFWHLSPQIGLPVLEFLMYFFASPYSHSVEGFSLRFTCVFSCNITLFLFIPKSVFHCMDRSRFVYPFTDKWINHLGLLWIKLLCASLYLSFVDMVSLP